MPSATKKKKKKKTFLKKYSRKIAKFQNRFFRFFFGAKPIATPSEHCHQISAPSV
jgi:hypothetical protein